jgi:2-keto-4-pentenoate hydratase/2-oxohepta-3-ene-1,7-dioic acid hydratase in catechol pathway
VRVARFSQGAEPKFGILDGPELVVLAKHPLISLETTGERVATKDVKLLAPTIPSKIVCIGMNYVAHAAEINHDVPNEPLMFFKPNSTVIGPGEAVVLPWQSDRVELEIELAIVIGKVTKDIAREQAKEHIWGFTIANDVTARDLQFSDLQWARSKGFDTFCPLGPWIETDFDPDTQALESRVNGELRQSGSVHDMVNDPYSLVAFVSENVTLLPGDVILTGSPSGISTIRHGDLIECEIEGIGTLINPVQNGSRTK